MDYKDNMINEYRKKIHQRLLNRRVLYLVQKLPKVQTAEIYDFSMQYIIECLPVSYAPP